MLFQQEKPIISKLIPDPRYTDNYITRQYTIHHPETSNVKGTLLPEIPYWAPHTPVFICADTGTGKSTFIMKELYPYAKSKRGKILVVSNRTALNTQYKREMLHEEQSPCEAYYTLEGLAAQDSFPGLDVQFCSYQALSGLMDRCRDNNPFLFVVFDEAHYFCADALFSEGVYKTLKRIPDVFRKSVRIYMTATPWEVRNLIQEVEKVTEYDMATRLFAAYYGAIAYPGCGVRRYHYYDFPRPQRDYRLHFLPAECRGDLTDNDALPELIKNSGDDKWIIFVNSKNAGRVLYSRLKDFCDVELLDADRKGTEAWNSLAENKKFDAKVLITTSVIDNGIDIKDDRVKNIVLTTVNRVEFMQELGRKRLSAGEHLNVYVPDLSARQLQWFINSNRDLIEHLRRFEECPTDDEKSKVAREYRARERRDEYFDGTNESRRLVQLGLYGGLYLDLCAKEHILHEKEFLAALKASESAHPFLDEACRWLGVESGHWIVNDPEEAKEALLNYMAQSCGDLAAKGDLDEFAAELKRLYEAAYGRRKNDRPDRVWGSGVIKTVIEELALPYVLVGGTKGPWKLKKEGDESNG